MRGTRYDRPGPDAADPDAIAREICLRLLSDAPRTRGQLGDALRRRRVPEEAAARVLDRFTDVGLIDDAAFARAWVTSRHSGRGLARRALADELRRRGVDRSTIESAVATVDPADEDAAARALVARRLPLMEGLDAAARVRRLTGMLGRKGYPAGVAYRVVREVLDDASAGPGGIQDPGWQELPEAADDG